MTQNRNRISRLFMAHEIYEWMEEERSQEYRASKIASLKAEEQHGKIGGGKTVHVKVEKCLKCVCVCVCVKKVPLMSFTVVSPARKTKSE